MEKQHYLDRISKIKDLLVSNESLVSYYKSYKDLQQCGIDDSIPEDKKIKIAVIGSSTLEGIKEVLDIKCRILGLYPSIYVAPYNQYNQEILDDNSSLYKFKSDLIIIWINADTLLSETFYFPYRVSAIKRKKIINDCFKSLTSLFKKLTSNTNAKVIIHNFETPYNSSMGILENKQEYGLIESIKDLNNKLAKQYKDDNQIFVFDFDIFTSKYGKMKVEDEKMRYFADMRVKQDFIPKLCDEYMGYIKPIKSLSKKCLVLDLDNTLWGGIVGEDGFEGIQLGPKPPCNAFVEFQKTILNLYERGIILAINSKNNPEDALKVINEHPYMVLREKYFAAIRINWNDKVTNIKELAEELGIGLDSLVFIDDDKVNRELMKSMLPEVLTIEMPEDPALYSQVLRGLNDFNILQLTEEDRQRGEMYAQQRKRAEVQKSSVNLEGFLKNLALKVSILKVDKFTIPRISQLTQKTNQFNMTTKRYLEEDIKRFSESKDYLVCSVKVEDKFGDNGLTGVVIVKKNKENWLIDTFLLSCRVLGREVEKVLIAFIIEKAKEENVNKIIGEFIPTKKNAPAKDFYANSKFELVGNTGEKETWSLDISRIEYLCPKFIKVDKGI